MIDRGRKHGNEGSLENPRVRAVACVPLLYDHVAINLRACGENKDKFSEMTTMCQSRPGI